MIAIEVLGRKPSFDSKSDPIVRVEAGRLRERLRAYYQGDGQADRVLITLPKGGYVPECSERQPPAPTTRIDVLRLSILPPEHASFDAFAVAPNGRHLAFTAALNGKLLLWVRALDALDPGCTRSPRFEALGTVGCSAMMAQSPRSRNGSIPVACVTTSNPRVSRAMRRHIGPYLDTHSASRLMLKTRRH